MRVRIRVGGGNKTHPPWGDFISPDPYDQGGELLAHPPWIPLCGTIAS